MSFNKGSNRESSHSDNVEMLHAVFLRPKTVLQYLYGCEVWGFSDNYVIEKIHFKFCKLILHLKQSTPNFMIIQPINEHLLGHDNLEEIQQREDFLPSINTCNDKLPLRLVLISGVTHIR